ncbi:MAG: radical SAM protein [Planctomycetota bacterium]|jgi:wyosine [tRNA(Phe)-imidazoG37] synthetase (radical SAM superfamily)
MADQKKYVYGPVPSRRLGLSLGIDIVPFKVCTLDCIYCQLGTTSKKTVGRRPYVPVEAVLAELNGVLTGGLQTDYITVGGSGEPTLHSELGRLINSIKQITRIPVALLTNGTLLYRQDVRTDCARADVVLPSLDAGDEQTFRKINRPHADITLERLISGLCDFRREFKGQIWLEVFLAAGLNTGKDQIAKIKDAVNRIQPDKVQLNTAVRPAAESGLQRLDAKNLQAIADQLGSKAEVVADLPVHHIATHVKAGAEDLLSMLKRRPCSLNDICSSLGTPQEEALRYITELQELGLVGVTEKDGTAFFRAK